MYMTLVGYAIVEYDNYNKENANICGVSVSEAHSCLCCIQYGYSCCIRAGLLKTATVRAGGRQAALIDADASQHSSHDILIAELTTTGRDLAKHIYYDISFS